MRVTVYLWFISRSTLVFQLSSPNTREHLHRWREIKLRCISCGVLACHLTFPSATHRRRACSRPNHLARLVTLAVPVTQVSCSRCKAAALSCCSRAARSHSIKKTGKVTSCSTRRPRRCNGKADWAKKDVFNSRISICINYAAKTQKMNILKTWCYLRNGVYLFSIAGRLGLTKVGYLVSRQHLPWWQGRIKG